MSGTHLDEEAIFDVARQIPTAWGRKSYLAHVCGDNTALLVRVESLLSVFDEEQDFLQVLPDELGATLDSPGESVRTGQNIGHYKLLQQIGEGGFGVVFMAEQQEPVRRKVALKVIKPGMDTKEVIARFEAERQALALMDHPNIAKVFDAGTTETGRPYFVMELVKGVPITEYCDQSNLSSEERMELFLSVCHAIHHAHQKGVIHRDIKPSNILLTLHDGTPVVKVIDFGVAKAINQRLTERTLFTKFSQIVGTPAYMSPEQAEMSGLDVDTRTDVYALGVLLYELLTGATPFDKKRFGEVAYDEIRRIIREEDPPKPSTKVSTLGDTATEICAHRNTEPKRLSALLRGDLDWIVMKAMEKDRARRYESSRDLASDIVRFLNHQPVEASPPSTLYRARKFVRRNRTFLGVAIAITLLVVSLAGGMGAVGLERLKSAARAAELRAKDAKLEIALRDKKLAKEEQEKIQQRQSDLEWRGEALPMLTELRDSKQWSRAFTLAEQLRERFPDDGEVLAVWSDVVCTWTVRSVPPGAEVFYKPYGKPDDEYRPLGTTPFQNVATSRDIFHWKIVKNGFASAEGCAGDESVELRANLELTTSPTVDMARIVQSLPDRDVDFFIDLLEVTNQQYKEFILAGGYETRGLWKHAFRNSAGTKFSWDNAMGQFVDETREPGPRGWRNGTYADGEDEYPVRGISWYEAAAYAEFVDKSLPTIHDWQLASGQKFGSQITDSGNLDSDAVIATDRLKGIGPYGTYGMAGNVKEWCSNMGKGGRRYILGGGWYEPRYMFWCRDLRDPMDRSEANGFRCVKYVRIPTEQTLADVVVQHRDYSQVKSVSDEEFAIIAKMYEYNHAPLNAEVIEVQDRPEFQHEVVEFDATYEDDRVILHIFLPKKVMPPYQSAIYFPTSDASKKTAFAGEGARRGEIAGLLDSGRVVVWPIYFGTYERGGGKSGTNWTTTRIRQVQDLRRTIDYLEERSDMDSERIAYVGRSWGAVLAPGQLALEKRFKAAVLLNGGLSTGTWGGREVDPFTFVSRVTVPIRLVNGKNDSLYPLESSQLPLLRYLGTPAADKDHCLFEGMNGPGHGGVPNDILTRQMVDWLNTYLGAVGTGSGRAGSRRVSVQTKLATVERYLVSGQFDSAETSCLEVLKLLKESDGNDEQETLRVQSRLACALAGQKRTDEAVSLFRDTLALQRDTVGQDHVDTQYTTKSFCSWLKNAAWNTAVSSARSAADYRQAERLARIVVDTDPAENAMWVVAYAQYRLGLTEACLASMRKSLDEDRAWTGQWFLMALAHHKLDQAELAESWYWAACEWAEKYGGASGRAADLHGQAAYVLGLPMEWPPAGWDRMRHVESYSRLIAEYPRVASLYYRRGSHYGRLAQWKNAGADYARAAELDAAPFGAIEAEAAVSLFVQDSEQPGAVMKRFLEVGRESPNMDTVLLCSLVPSTEIDRREIDEMADEILAQTKTRFFLELGKGMSLYRLGRYEDALATIPHGSARNPKDEFLAILFRAMAHYQLGDQYTCRYLLDEARSGIRKQIALPDGAMLPFQDRPVVWCMVHSALREAEQLIESDENRNSGAISAGKS